MPLVFIIISIIGSLLIGGEVVNYTLTSQPSPTPISSQNYSNSAYITEKISPTITQKVVYIPTPTTDPDPTVTCNIQAECGGAKQMRLSACSKSTCCKIGDKWYYYHDLPTCKKDQEVFYSNLKQDIYDSFGQLKSAINNSTSSMQNIQIPTPVYPTISYPTSSQLQNTDSGVHCYATWDDYFKAHPGYVGNVSGLGPNPPCN